MEINPIKKPPKIFSIINLSAEKNNFNTNNLNLMTGRSFKQTNDFYNYTHKTNLKSFDKGIKLNNTLLNSHTDDTNKNNFTYKNKTEYKKNNLPNLQVITSYRYKDNSNNYKISEVFANDKDIKIEDNKKKKCHNNTFKYFFNSKNKISISSNLNNNSTMGKMDSKNLEINFVSLKNESNIYTSNADFIVNKKLVMTEKTKDDLKDNNNTSSYNNSTSKINNQDKIKKLFIAKYRINKTVENSYANSSQNQNLTKRGKSIKPGKLPELGSLLKSQGTNVNESDLKIESIIINYNSKSLPKKPKEIKKDDYLYKENKDFNSLSGLNQKYIDNNSKSLIKNKRKILKNSLKQIGALNISIDKNEEKLSKRNSSSKIFNIDHKTKNKNDNKNSEQQIQLILNSLLSDCEELEQLNNNSNNSTSFRNKNNLKGYKQLMSQKKNGLIPPVCPVVITNNLQCSNLSEKNRYEEMIEALTKLKYLIKANTRNGNYDEYAYLKEFAESKGVNPSLLKFGNLKNFSDFLNKDKFYINCNKSIKENLINILCNDYFATDYSKMLLERKIKFKNLIKNKTTNDVCKNLEDSNNKENNLLIKDLSLKKNNIKKVQESFDESSRNIIKKVKSKSYVINNGICKTANINKEDKMDLMENLEKQKKLFIKNDFKNYKNLRDDIKNELINIKIKDLEDYEQMLNKQNEKFLQIIKENKKNNESLYNICINNINNKVKISNNNNLNIHNKEGKYILATNHDNQAFGEDNKKHETSIRKINNLDELKENNYRLYYQWFNNRYNVDENTFRKKHKLTEYYFYERANNKIKINEMLVNNVYKDT